MEMMSVRSRISPLTVAVMLVVVFGSALAASVTFTATAYAAPDNASTYEGRYLNVAYSAHGNSSAPRHWSGTKSSSGTSAWSVITNPQTQTTGTGTTASSTPGWTNEHNHNGRNDRNNGVTIHHPSNWNTYNWNNYYGNYYNGYNYYWGPYNYGETVTAQLTIYTSGQGTTSPSIGIYSYTVGSVVTVTAYPNSGYGLSYWTVDGINYAPTASITIRMDYNHSVTACFTGGP